MLARTHLALAPALVALTAAATASAQIIPTGQISGFLDSESLSALGETDTSLTYTQSNGFVVTGDFRAEITAEAMRQAHWSKFSGFSGLRTGVQDTYTVTTANPGEEIVFNATLRATGTSTTVFRPNALGDYVGYAFMWLNAGGDLLNGGVFNGSPAIESSFGKVSSPQLGIINDGTGVTRRVYEFTSVDFDHEIQIPLRVTEGQPFTLAFSGEIRHSGAIATDMDSGGITVTFDLPAGASISSVNGFGTTDQTPPCPDTNGDNTVNTADLLDLLANFGQAVPGGPADGDFDNSGAVDTADLLALLGVFGTGC